ncbi:MAG: aspartate aminotransferase family protein [Bacillota bacterium]|nr:aspartate aminotransferase family protein [Bacillota bacterium]MDW7730762.1 aspartate aminotransferase family protein [Bacillota bacterium]
MGALLPKGVSKEIALEQLSGFTEKDVNWRTGKVMTGLYDPGETAHELAVEAYTSFLAQNALWITMYPSIGKIEKEVVSSVADLLRADDEVAGNMTSGGTESILIAVKTARDWARVNRPDIKEPEMVVPVTAHPAFLKAAHYFGLNVIQTDVELNEYRADLDSYRNALSQNTIIAAGSAPNYSHGSIDPIREMAEIARERGILFHVDGCIGGIYLSILRRMGEPVRDFDFSVPGVTSISADLHKYGYTPKNASVILYRNRELRKYAWFVSSATPIYVLINPTIQSSKTGGPVAAAWATQRFLGEEGFQNIVRDSQKATKLILNGIKDIEGIKVLGNPDMCMFTLASDEINIFELDDHMREKGWHLAPQFACGGSPPNLHVGLSHANVPYAEMFVKDLEEVVHNLRHKQSAINDKELAKIVNDVLNKPIEDVMMAIIPVIGLTGMDLPEKMAPLNTVLNLLPVKLRDELLTVFFNMTS